MQAGYFATAWADIKESKGWFGKMCLLGLLMFVPVFGPIVLYGYFWGWARDIAWNVHKPLPERVFANEDGKLYRRGWFILVVLFVLSLLPMVIWVLYNVVADASTASLAVMSSHNSAAFGSGASGVSGASAAIAALLYLCFTAALVVVQFFGWVGAIRSAIYDNIGSGLQLGVIWKMMRKDFGGLARIFGMNLIFNIVFGIILSILVTAVLVICFASALPQLLSLYDTSFTYDSYAYGGSYTGGAPMAQLLGLLGPAIGAFLIFMLVFTYASLVFSCFLEALTCRAVGYWTRQFRVAEWGGQQDKLPFEREAAYAASAAAAAPVGYAQQPGSSAPAGSQQPPVQGQQPSVQPAPAPAPAAQPAPAEPAPVVQPAPAPEPAAQPAPAEPEPAAQPAPAQSEPAPDQSTAPEDSTSASE